MAHYTMPEITVEAAIDLIVELVMGSLFYLGEEIGWRGFLLQQLTKVLPRERAWLATGACHAIYHLPLLLLTTTYQGDGNRLVVVPMVMVTNTFAGVAYAWIRERSGGIWAVCLLHNTFTTVFERLALAAVTSSAATLAYVTTETGVMTLITVGAVAAGLLKLRQSAPEPTPIHR